MPALTLENIETSAAKHGAATEEEIEVLADEMYAVARDPLTAVANPRIVQVVGENL